VKKKQGKTVNYSKILEKYIAFLFNFLFRIAYFFPNVDKNGAKLLVEIV
jgi:hypothetical protein